VETKIWRVEEYLHILTSKVGDLFSKAARIVHWTDELFSLLNNAMPQANAIIVFTKSWSLVDNSSTRVVSNILIR